MPTLKVNDPETGKTFSFNLPEGTTPNESMVMGMLTQAKQQMGGGGDSGFQGGTTRGAGVTGEFEPLSTTQKAVGAAMPYARPIAEGLGMAGGSILGTPAGPAGSVAGGALGYGMAKTALDAVDTWAKGQPQPGPVASAKKAAVDLGQGAAMEAGGQMVAPALGLVGKAAAQVLGRTTGKGPVPITRLAAEGGESAKRALRGDTSKEAILQEARDALYGVKDEMRQAYRTELQGLEANKQPIDLSPLKERVAKLKKAFGIEDITREVGRGKTKTTVPDYDLSRSGIDVDQRTKVAKMLEDIDSWGNKPSDSTVAGLDTLKKTLDDFYSESKRSRALVTQLRTEVKDLIVKAYPRYAEMMKDYESHLKLIKEVEKGLSLGDKSATETAINKLMGAMREGKEYRKGLLEKIQPYAGADIEGQLAGAAMNPWTPNIAPSTALFGLGGAAGAHHYLGVPLPYELAGVALSSPRLMGEGALAVNAMRGALPPQTPQYLMPGAVGALRGNQGNQ